MTRDDIKTEIFGILTENASWDVSSTATDTTDRIMKKVDDYVKSCVVKAHIEVMKNFRAI